MLELPSSDRQALYDLAQALICTPSVSGNEGNAARLLAEAMRYSGFDAVWTDRIGNVIGRYGAGHGPVLLFEGHMDTVDVGDRGAWTHDPFGGEIADGFLYGRGAVDMKSSLAAMVHGIKLLADARAPLVGEVYVAFVVQEEPCEGLAVQTLLKQEGLQPDFIVLGEPTNLGVYTGQRGRVELQVSTYGRAGHAAMPQDGVNAIGSAARLIFGIELLALQLLTDPVLGQGSIAVTQITSSASSLNTIPDLCTLVLDRRLTLGETETRAITEIQQIIRREGIRGDVTTPDCALTSYTGHVMRGRKYFPPWLLPDEAPLVRQTVKAIERTLGAHPRLGLWPFSTDGAYTMGTAGIPTIGFGPGDEHAAHTADERVRLADIATAARGYAQLAVELLK